MNFIYDLYQKDNFTLILVVLLVILIIAFVVVYFFGKKDQKLEETKRLQKIELDTFKEEKLEPAKLEVKEEVPVIKNEEVNVTEFKPEVKENVDVIVDNEVKNENESIIKPLFKDTEEEKSPISISELPDIKEDDSELVYGLNSLESIRNEFNSIEIPEVKEEKVEEKPIFKPSPQIFSSVFVDKREDDIVTNNSNNEKEVVTKVEEEKNDNSTSKLFTIIDDEDEEMELPSLNKSVDEVSGEVYTLK